jgi:predicted ATPase
MNPVLNPYAPGAGSQPPELAGREELLEAATVALDRVRAGRYERSFIAVGLRGVGKTVLLNRVRELAEARDFKIAFVEAREDQPLPLLLLPHLRRLLLELDRLGALSTAVKRALRVFKSFISAIKLRQGDLELILDVDPERGSADSGQLEADLPELFSALGRAAKDRGTAVLLLVDELQYIPEAEMGALIMALHRTSQEGLPMLLVAAGLPQLVAQTGRSKSYAERLFAFPAIGALRDADARRALTAPAKQAGIEFSDDALDEILRQTQGYPFFLQEWGYSAWNLAQASPITRAAVDLATRQAISKLDASFFRVRFDRLTPRERDYLRAMADLGDGPLRSGDIAERLGIRVMTAGPLRGGLIRKGMIHSPAHGDTDFTVPLFGAFLRRTMPDWSPRTVSKERRK